MPLTSELDLAHAFGLAMDRLGPFEPRPALAVAVSGGADSMALVLLARDWVAARGGSVLALVVDHGLRPEAGREADITLERLAAQDIPARLLRLTTLVRGPALAERARTQRYRALASACQQAGLLHLLLGHHAADQAETLAMRVLQGSRSFGLAGIAALRETATLRLLRPLLAVPPAALRIFLEQRRIAWVEDPSNQDERALRPRLRRKMRLPDPGLVHAAALAGKRRARDEADIAARLADRVTLRPEGFALLTAGRIDAEALRALLRVIAGAAYPVTPGQITELAADPRPATLGGVRLMSAARLGPGLLVLREEAAIEPPVPAGAAILWDRRFRVAAKGNLAPGLMVGKLGGAAAIMRKKSDLPSAVLRTLPALWQEDRLMTVPHLAVFLDDGPQTTALFTPPWPMAGPEFASASSSEL